MVDNAIYRRNVALWCARQAPSDYVTAPQATGPDRPLNRYGSGAIVDVIMKSVTPVGTNSAMVRYATRRHDQRGQASTVQSWVAVLRYRYSGEPVRVASRFVNPPGF